MKPCVPLDLHTMVMMETCTDAAFRRIIRAAMSYALGQQDYQEMLTEEDGFVFSCIRTRVDKAMDISLKRQAARYKGLEKRHQQEPDDNKNQQNPTNEQQKSTKNNKNQQTTPEKEKETEKDRESEKEKERSKEKEREKETEKGKEKERGISACACAGAGAREEQESAGPARFRAPTVEEVAAYCRERGNSVEPEMFVDFYAAKGWKVGNQPMKDWKACVRTWERNRSAGITGSSGASGGTGRTAPRRTVSAQQYTQRDYSNMDQVAFDQMIRQFGESYPEMMNGGEIR